jgi:XTP/dITP diphosphohydrolase
MHLNNRILFIGSGNPNKIREMSSLFSEFSGQIYSAIDLNIPEPEEDQDTFIGNAELKAKYYGKHAKEIHGKGVVAIADDSGLCIEALDGKPGIHSARWAGPKKDFSYAVELIRQEMKAKYGENYRRYPAAYFFSVISLYDTATAQLHSYSGKFDGHVDLEIPFEVGFGYEPVFVPKGYDKTLHQLGWQKKMEISHRALAFEALKASLTSTPEKG